MELIQNGCPAQCSAVNNGLWCRQPGLGRERRLLEKQQLNKVRAGQRTMKVVSHLGNGALSRVSTGVVP